MTKNNKPMAFARSWRYRSSVGVRYAIGVLLVSAAWIITTMLRETFDTPSFQTPFFFCAIVLGSWIGGFGPGILATILSAFAVKFSFAPPPYSIGFSMIEIPKFAVFFVTGGFISWLGGRQRRDEEALLQAGEKLEEKVRARTADLQTANELLTAEVGERIKAEKELQRLNRAWRVRSICNRAVTRSVDERDLLRRVCQAIIKVGGYRMAWVGFPESGETRTIRPIAYAGQSSDTAEDIKPAWVEDGWGHDLARTVIRTGLAEHGHERLDDVHPHPPCEWAVALGIKAVVALPLITDVGPIGSLLVYSEELEAFDEKERSLLQQAANDVAQGVALLRVRAARLHAEEALKKTEAELTRVARATTMGELTASIAHELNQPLAALVTNANACLRWLALETPNLDEARSTAQRIVRDGNRAADVIARIRALLSKEQTLRQSLNVNTVIMEILPLIEGEMRRRKATLALELARDLPSVEMDRVQIQQLLMNLLVNALDAMNAVTDRPRILGIRTSVDSSGSVLVAVQDSGIGLPQDQMDRLFDPFYTTKEKGMGMGLSISRSIVETHGGRLWATSDQGAGATFHFTLPTRKGIPT
jgi:signal transduction histidine kinase